jgi:alanine-glyoxylate transaminase / serine-glyoxylate transaminase / serine-pyruvate transaminase
MPRRGRDFIQLPGPTNLPDRVLRAMHRPMVDFAGADFTAMARGCLDDLRRVFQTEGAVYAYSANGHGAWEVAFDNLIAPGETVLMPETGRFSQSWAEMAEALGVRVLTTRAFHDCPLDPAALETVLAADRDHAIKAVAMVHVETSTGITHDVAAVRKAIDATGHPALLVVDAIASLGCVDLAMDRLGVDLVVTASQKGLMMPAGMAFVAVGERARAVAASGGAPRRYWDWRLRTGAESYFWFYGTPPVQMMFALREALDMLFEEGLPAVFARHQRLAEATRRAVARWGEDGDIGFQCAVAAARSDVVTALTFPSGADPDALRALCRERLSVAFGGGIGPFAGRLLRIGHLGDLNEPMLLGALGGLEIAMRASGVPHVGGGVDAAAQYLADTLA